MRGDKLVGLFFVCVCYWPRRRLSEQVCFSNNPCFKFSELHPFKDEICSSVAYNQNDSCLASSSLTDASCLVKDHSSDFKPYLYSVRVKERYVNAPFSWQDHCILQEGSVHLSASTTGWHGMLGRKASFFWKFCFVLGNKMSTCNSDN